MSGLKQSKRVSWPTDVNLCKVRLFLSEDAPSQSRLGSQDHLQAKAAWLLHAAGLAESDDSLPPGFEAPPKHRLMIDIPQIPIIKWQCPPCLLLNPEWLVVTGEESEEVDAEKLRLLGVLEAVYPRPSSIPQNPYVAPEVQAAHMDEPCTPLIPVTAIEEEEGTDEPANHAPMQLRSSPNAGNPWHSTFEQLNPRRHPEQPPSSAAMPTSGHAPTAEPDVLAAASAAFTAIMRSSEEESLIDGDLLIEILSNPVMVEKLVSGYGAPKQAPPPRQPAVTAPVASAPRPPPPPIAISAPAPPMPHMFTAMHLQHASRPVHIAPPTQAHGHPTRDASYYKSLIQLHGGDKPDASGQNPMLPGNTGDRLRHHHNGGDLNQRELKPKFPKPCAFFNAPRGCKHGSSCLFQHDASSVPERIEQHKGVSKRIKLDWGIDGRN